MGIALSDPDSGGRSKLASAAFTVIGLAFFFGVGLAGGAAYKIYFTEDSGPQLADQVSPPPAASATPPDQILAANAPNSAEKPAADSSPVAPATAPPTPEPQAAPAPVEAAEPAVMAQAASSPAPAAPETAAPAAASEPPTALAAPPAIPDAATAPAAPDSQAALPAAEPTQAAVTLEKPATAAKAHRPTATKTMPQTATLHPPPAAASPAGHFHVQFGAFANEENARRVQSAVAATGLKVEIRHETGASGNPLFFVRSPSYPDRASALNAAQAAQNRAKHSANPTAIDYAIIPDRAAAPEQHAQR